MKNEFFWTLLDNKRVESEVEPRLKKAGYKVVKSPGNTEHFTVIGHAVNVFTAIQNIGSLADGLTNQNGLTVSRMQKGKWTKESISTSGELSKPHY